MVTETTKPDTGCTVTDICIEHGRLREALKIAMAYLPHGAKYEGPVTCRAALMSTGDPE